MNPVAFADITGLVLAGGRGSRMGGVDKGLQRFEGVPLARRALLRLGPQVGALAVNANRNLPEYVTFGVPVWTDALADFTGPLAGFLSGLESCDTAFLLTVPCDTPFFPLDLATRLAGAMASQDAEIAMAAAPESTSANGSSAQAILQRQPVFSLMRTTLRESLVRFTRDGGRKVGTWAALHRTVFVPFDRSDDAPDAFFNANTLDELRALETR